LSMSPTCRPLILLLIFSEVLRLHALTDESSSAQTMASPPFHTTSFDCAKAKELSTEAAICKNEELAKLDVETAAAYKKRLASATASEKSQLVLSQRRWLMIRNSHNVNPYHGDPAGALLDLADFYRRRVAALQSGRMDLLETKIPREYDWLIATAPEGFSKEFAISRAYVSCEDPCKTKPSVRRWISIGGNGIGPEPGDIDTPYTTLVKRLASEGWIKCRSAADDSGKLQVDHFNNGDKMVSVSRSYSMGAGNGIGFAVTISGPLPQGAAKPVPNPSVTITDDWETYSSPEVGLKVRYPPDWHMRDATPPNAGPQYRYLLFAADDYKPGDFRITVEPIGVPGPDLSNDAPKCFTSRYRISGFTAKECLFEDELSAESVCTRYLKSISIRTDKYDFTFEPATVGSLPDESGNYHLTDLYEKILGTIEMK
jgi:uncharacterized protein YecT (DUF1311 family)